MIQIYEVLLTGTDYDGYVANASDSQSQGLFTTEETATKYRDELEASLNGETDDGYWYNMAYIVRTKDVHDTIADYEGSR